MLLAGCSGGDALTRTVERTTGDGSPSPPAPGGGWQELLASEQQCPDQRETQASAGRLRASAICLINHARSERGLRELPTSQTLHESARGKAKNIIRCGEFSHSACGRSEKHWFEQVDYLEGCLSGGTGENLGIGERQLGSSRRIVLGWLQSPGHRRNMLSDRWQEQAITIEQVDSWSGTFESKTHTFRDVSVWVSHFGATSGC